MLLMGATVWVIIGVVVVVLAWMSEAGDLNWEAGCDISESEDEVIDGLDLAVFVGSWLEN